RINAPSSSKLKYSNSMAAERICANGLAMFKPLACENACSKNYDASFETIRRHRLTFLPRRRSKCSTWNMRKEPPRSMRGGSLPLFPDEIFTLARCLSRRRRRFRFSLSFRRGCRVRFSL
ncbi:hypothetical protein, partial [Pyramidobacter piscolens]|uniref:hypothetical protein n=1 Tax=Pyramidobacter piscolens TaxID=638849 RepID=UPI003AB5167A